MIGNAFHILSVRAIPRTWLDKNMPAWGEILQEIGQARKQGNAHAFDFVRRKYLTKLHQTRCEHIGGGTSGSARQISCRVKQYLSGRLPLFLWRLLRRSFGRPLDRLERLQVFRSKSYPLITERTPINKLAVIFAEQIGLLALVAKVNRDLPNMATLGLKNICNVLQRKCSGCEHAGYNLSVDFFLSRPSSLCGSVIPICAAAFFSGCQSW